MNRKYLIYILALLFLLVSAGYYIYNTYNKSDNGGVVDVFIDNHDYTNESNSNKVYIGSTKILVTVAKTASEKSKGLSGREDLAENHGMIFIFTPKTYPAFWMKDMNFALDIIWISDDTIVHIDENVPPPGKDQKDNELPLYRPPEAVNYVLEVNAGFSQNNGIKVGDKIDLTGLK